MFCGRDVLYLTEEDPHLDAKKGCPKAAPLGKKCVRGGT